MATRGKRLDREIEVDYMQELIYKYGGNIKNISKFLQCSRDAIYDYLDIHHELKEDLEKARGRAGEYTVESCYDVLDSLVENAVEDPSNAFKAINLALTRSKISRYYTEKNPDANTNIFIDSDRIAQKIQEFESDSNSDM